MSAADKEDVRSELLQGRRARTFEEIETARVAIRRHIVGDVARFGWSRVAAFVPLRTEPSSVELLDELTSTGVTVYVPITLPDHDLDWTIWGSPIDPLGVEAIAGAELVLVPALAVARDGTRLGRGGGSYDRALPRTWPGIPVAAIVFSDEVREELPRDPWDYRVKYYITPEGWYLTSAGTLGT